MGNRVQWIEHKGETILFCDYANIRNEEEFIQALAKTETEVLKQEPGTFILMLIDATNARLTPAVTAKTREVAAAAREKGIPSSPTAIVGVSAPAQKAIVMAMQFLRPDLRLIESVPAAKDWLVSRAGE
jgi:hypothetical protein